MEELPAATPGQEQVDPSVGAADGEADDREGEDSPDDEGDAFVVETW